MNNKKDKVISVQANIGVGASLGAVGGALLAAWIFKSPIYTLSGSLLGAIIGAVINAKRKSYFSEMLWITYSKRTGIWMLVSGLLLTLMIFWSAGSVDKSEPGNLFLMRMILIPVAVLMAIIAVKKAFSELDDLQRKIQHEAIVIGYAIIASTVLIIGLYDLTTPIPSNWLITFIFISMSWLIGRLAATWRYR